MILIRGAFTMTPVSRANIVLVTYASKMGGTKDIADAIGAELANSGVEVTLLDAASVYSVDRFDAVVLGSSLYIRRWLPDAITVLRLLAKRDSELGSIPVWLFQSGPCGDSARTEQVPSPRKVRRYADRLGAAHPMTFGGRLDPALTTGFIARKMATGSLAGDFRDFDAIRSWAKQIGSDLMGRSAGVHPAQRL
jgi:menaquinone-dependent protoporphyrinogen oxidase